jgi:hypothetical protein
MPMNKGVEGPITGNAGRVPDSRVAVESASVSEDRVIRRRHRHHRRHQTLTRRSGRATEIAVVTFLALAVLFGILYYLLPHFQAVGEESNLRSGTRVAALWGRG